MPRCGQVVERDHAHAVPARHLAGDRVEERVLVDDERLAVVSSPPSPQRLARARRSRRWPVLSVRVRVRVRVAVRVRVRVRVRVTISHSNAPCRHSVACAPG